MSELRTIAETAEKLRVSRATVYRLIADRKLKVTKVRNSSFVTDSEIDRYVAGAQRGRLA